jgi:flagellar protein FlaI
VSQEELEALRYLLLRDKDGMGNIQPLISDPYIEDVSCSGVGSIFIEHKVFGGLKTRISFDTEDALDNYVIKLSEKIGKPVTVAEPIVDATLPDGSRVNIVFGNDVAKRGSNFTIRKFSPIPMSVLDLIEGGTLSYEMAAYISLMVEEGMNTFVSGETASGKTTLLNAISTFISPTAKIVSIEDTPELQVPHPNWIREVIRGSGKDDESSVTMFDLLRAALRQRPNEIIIGEIRGQEGAIAFQAMQTGHACMATFHASSVEKLIQRLTGDPINIPKAHVDNLNLVIIMSSVRLPGGRIARRVLSINEIVGFNPEGNSFDFIEVFRWNSSTDSFDFPGYMNTALLEQTVASKRGIPPQEKRKIYDQVENRAEILRKLNERQLTNFYELHSVLSQANKQGLL